MEERKFGKKTGKRTSHVIPLNFNAGSLEPQDLDIPIAACDCDGYCEYSRICAGVVNDVPVDVNACGIWG